MPLPSPAGRREVHQRVIEMKVYARDDRLFDVESWLVDRKPFDFWRATRTEPVPAGQPLHDLRIRLTVDAQLVVREIAASSDVTPFALCREAEATLSFLVGERIASGWSSKVRGGLRGAAGCTHLMEMLITLATTAMQGVRGLRRTHGKVDDRADIVGKLDSCYAYSSEREVVRVHWPEHHRPPAPRG